MLLVPLVLSTSFIFIDSYSLVVWEHDTHVGSATIVLRGRDVYKYSTQIEEIEGVNHSAYVLNAWSSIVSLSNNTIPTSPLSLAEMAPGGEPPAYIDLAAGAISSDFESEFPNIYKLLEGRFPRNESEVSLVDTVANQLGVRVGESIRYSNETGTPGPGGALFRYTVELQIVGIYSFADRIDDNPLPYTRGYLIVDHAILGVLETDCWVYVDVDESVLDPLQPEASLTRLRELDERIKQLDPNYGTNIYWTGFYLEDLTAVGILNYMEWIQTNRIRQIIDSVGLVFVSLVASFLFVGRYLTKRKSEVELLNSRGASRKSSFIFLLSELVGCAAIAIPIGILSSFILTRFGLFQYASNSSFLSIPFLLKIDALIVIISLSLFIPTSFLYVQMRFISKPNDVTYEPGKLNKISRALSLLQLDVAVTVIVLLIIITLTQIGSLTQNNLFLVDFAPILPLLFFLCFGNILRKLAPKGAEVMSRLLEPVVGKSASRIGIRHLGRGGSQFILSFMVISLIMTMLWTSTVIETNSTSSYLSQMRFSISGDLTFKLDVDGYDQWNDFRNNVTEMIPNSESTFLTKQILFLSSGLEGAASFHAINPDEYAQVAYDQTGVSLNETEYAPLLTRLEANVTGAIVTKDIADEFQLSVGGPLRGFLSNGTDFELLLFSVIGIVDVLPDVLVEINGGLSPLSAVYPDAVGTGKVWVNREYALQLLDVETTTANYLCVRAPSSDTLEEDIDTLRNNGGDAVIDAVGIGISYLMANELLQSETYQLTWNFRHLLNFQLAVAIFLVLVPLAESLIYNDKRIHFLLDSLGYDTENVQSVDRAKSISLFLSTLVVTMLLFPILFATTTYFYLGRNYAFFGSFPSMLIITDYLSVWLLLLPLTLILFTLVFLVSHRVDYDLSSIRIGFTQISYNFEEGFA